MSGCKKKISIIAHDLAGGGMTRAYALALALMHSGHDVEIIGMKLSPGPVYPLPPENLTVIEMLLCCSARVAIAGATGWRHPIRYETPAKQLWRSVDQTCNERASSGARY